MVRLHFCRFGASVPPNCPIPPNNFQWIGCNCIHLGHIMMKKIAIDQSCHWNMHGTDQPFSVIWLNGNAFVMQIKGFILQILIFWLLFFILESVGWVEHFQWFEKNFFNAWIVDWRGLSFHVLFPRIWTEFYLVLELVIGEEIKLQI